MEKVWICLVLLSMGPVIAQVDDDVNQLDSWDYNSFYDDILHIGDIPGEDEQKSNKEKNDSIEDNYEDADPDDDALFEDPGKDKVENIVDDDINDDYQIEDNRSAPKDEEDKEELPLDTEKLEQDVKVKNDEEFKAVAVSSSKENVQDINLLSISENKEEVVGPAVDDIMAKQIEKPENEKLALVNDSDNSNLVENLFDTKSDLELLPLPLLGIVDEESKKVLQETPDALNKDHENNFADHKIVINNIPDIAVDTPVDEAQQLLEEIDKNSNVKNKFAEETDNIKDELDFDELTDEDTFNKVYQDLNNDIDKLMETWKKLSIGDIKGEVNPDDSFDVADYEEKYGRPYGEGIVLSQRDDYYDNINDDLNNNDKSDVAPNVNDKNDNVEKSNDQDLQQQNANEQKDNDSDDLVDKEIDNSKESNLADLQETVNIAKTNFATDTLSQNLKAIDDNEDFDKILAEAFSLEDPGLTKSANNEVDINSQSDTLKNKVEDVKLDESLINNKKVEDVTLNLPEIVNEKKEMPEKPIIYIEDALSPNEKEDTQSDQAQSETQQNTVTTIDVSDLNPAQYDQLMTQFKSVHEKDLDVHSEDFGKNVKTNHITLILDKPVEVTSPNYPDSYPANNIVDWVFEGDGVGIEFNITEFAVNGVNGDYLLVKPGGVDESGHDGLVFSYHLKEPRKYRFLDVDRLFVRFVSEPSSFKDQPSSPYRFSISVRLISPLPQMEDIIPEPEVFLPEPKETYTLHLGLTNMNLTEFRNMEESFRILLADMANMYINANGIIMGLNTTLEVTQITGIKTCHMSWPDAHRCAELTFGVPLIYEEDDADDYRLSREDLKRMWNTYSIRDPFATRLRRMEITEFTPPNDVGVLTIWLVIGAGVLISVVMLAVALWRYSCFDSYSRMPEFSDTASDYKEKRGLDLYPTPHQTLPSLYDGDYQWADGEDTTRVDMGGFTNRSFVRDQNMYDIDSDEEVPPAHERKAVITPKMVPKV